MDSDLLFFADTADFIMNNNTNRFIEDVWTNYLDSPENLERWFGVHVPERINIGFGVLDTQILNPSDIEKLLLNERVANAPYLIDQTLIAILAAKYDVNVIGGDYKMSLNEGIEGKPMKHYTRVIRHQFYTEGVRYLVKKLKYCLN